LDLQALAVLIVVVAAGYYVVRNLLPRKQKGCGSCPQNPRRQDDYV
jgi:hypothetical protein